jgi:Wadjet anti plasmid transformation system JetA-like protein
VTARSAPPPGGAGGRGADGTLTARAARLAAALEEWPRPRRTVTIDELWSVWDGVEPQSAGSPTRRASLASAVQELVDTGLVTRSAAQDTSAVPPLPRRITLPVPEPSPSAALLAQRTAWRPELAWAASARLTVAQVERLRQLNTWFRDHAHETDQIPLRERSVQVLGHEKALDGLLKTGLFGPDRLSLELLRTYRTKPPLPAVRVGDGSVLLVVENDNTFHSLRSVLTSAPGPIGYIAWGAGGAFEASVRSVPDLAGVDEVRYFGDLDTDGLRIPRNAATTALAEGLPPVRPAVGLYRRLLRAEMRQSGQQRLTGEAATDLVAWLPDADLAASAARLLVHGQRIPQEALSFTQLSADTGWVTELGCGVSDPL